MTENFTLAGTFDLAGRPTPRIGYGMGGVSRKAAQGPEQHRHAVALLRRAHELGIRLYDTAHFYEDGLANRLIHEALGDHRDELCLASKVGAKSTPGAKFPMAAAQFPQDLRDSVEANLATLGTDRLDLVYLRRMDMLPGLVVGEDQQVPLADQLAELVALREEGKIRAIGLSHVSEEQVREALPAGIAAVQNIYSLLSREADPVLALAEAEGIAWIPYYPLGGGFAKLPLVVENDAVRQVARARGCTPQQVGQAWLLAHSPYAMLISGTGSREHLEENAAAGDVVLTDEDLALLDAQAGQGEEARA